METLVDDAIHRANRDRKKDPKGNRKYLLSCIEGIEKDDVLSPSQIDKLVARLKRALRDVPER